MQVLPFKGLDDDRSFPNFISQLFEFASFQSWNETQTILALGNLLDMENREYFNEITKQMGDITKYSLKEVINYLITRVTCYVDIVLAATFSDAAASNLTEARRQNNKCLYTLVNTFLSSQNVCKKQKKRLNVLKRFKEWRAPKSEVNAFTGNATEELDTTEYKNSPAASLQDEINKVQIRPNESQKMAELKLKINKKELEDGELSSFYDSDEDKEQFVYPQLNHDTVVPTHTNFTTDDFVVFQPVLPTAPMSESPVPFLLSHGQKVEIMYWARIFYEAQSTQTLAKGSISQLFLQFLRLRIDVFKGQGCRFINKAIFHCPNLKADLKQVQAEVIRERQF